MHSVNQRFDNLDIPEDEFMASGNLACAGCAASLSMRLALKGLGKPTVLVIPACCWTIIPGAWPLTAMDVPVFQAAFETTGATISGIKAAYRKRGMDDICVVGWAGDGGTFDIGIQALSGAAERNEDIIYICYDNEAYMNTGIQRSSATPYGASTTTSPAGKVSIGQVSWKKNMPAIAAAHNIPYVAQAAPSQWRDLMQKTRKAVDCGGAAFMNVLASCNRGWRHPTDTTIEMTQLGVDTCYWPLFEVENGEWKLTYKPKEKRPVEEWLKLQGRFRHVFKPENRYLIDELQEEIDRRWEQLLKLCGES